VLGERALAVTSESPSVPPRELEEARELAESTGIPPDTTARLDALDQLIGRTAQQTAVRSGAIVEQLTDRELSILRAMQGNLSLRELGAEFYLSHNTVKGYARILHRKLGVHTRADAVARGRDLGLI
jgi:LuxR family maltose regulon positive regulatory protein